jgi:predicted nucleotide-binding protein (sugar kinase/HSP70/actin superfamily)
MVKFTEEMKKTHTILIPNMLPVHFKLMIEIFKTYGYNMVLLESTSTTVIDEGLKNVHNDTCYPALLVVGQFMEALKSGKYDPDKTALLITQTGGGCRASNYIHLLRKCVESQFPNVPVISLNFSGLEKDSAFQITPKLGIELLYAVLYGDLLMTLKNQCIPYELNKGDTEKVLEKWQNKLAEMFRKGSVISEKPSKKLYREIINDFANIKRSKEKKIKVGIIGEIYVKYSPLANNHLEDFLISEGCEPVVPLLLEFCMYCTVTAQTNHKLYGHSAKSANIMHIAYNVLHGQLMKIIEVMKESKFDPPHDFNKLREAADKYINQGVSMGEGWMITAEMAVLAETGVENIICTQPFGCLPNHIVAKGMARKIKETHPNANIVAIDYDPGATKVNQENRIKLMLANARLPKQENSKVTVN